MANPVPVLRVLGLLTVMGLAALLWVSRDTPRPAPAVPAGASPAALSAASAIVADEVAEVRALMASCEADPIELSPWDPAGAGAAAHEVDCPLVLSCVEHLAGVRVQPGLGCAVVGANAPRAEGLNWVRLRVEAGHEARATVFQDRGPCPFAVVEHPVPPAGVGAYNRIAAALFGRMPADTAAGRAAVVRELPDPLDPARQAADVRVDAFEGELLDTIAGAVEQASDDPVWSEPGKRAAVRRGFVALQRVLALDPRRWDAWQDLGMLLHKSGQQGAARLALVRALALWPESYWSWRDLGQTERGTRQHSLEPHDALRHLKLARRFHEASGLSVFWMKADLESSIRQLEKPGPR